MPGREVAGTNVLTGTFGQISSDTPSIHLSSDTYLGSGSRRSSLINDTQTVHIFFSILGSGLFKLA